MIEALLAANRPQEALSLLDDSRLRETRSTKFWRGQALAGLRRWSEALPFYEEVAADASSPLRAEAIFGAAETLRALGRLDEAQQKLAILFRDKQWNVRARLHSAELFLDKQEPVNARRILDEVRPDSGPDRKTRRFLLGRVEMAQHHPERAVPIFQALLKKPEGASAFAGASNAF